MSRLKTKKIFFAGLSLSIISAGIVVWFVHRTCSESEIETVYTEEFKNSLSAFGFVVRNEETVKIGSEYPHTNFMFMYCDGEKISKNSLVAKGYKSEQDAVASYKINGIDKETEDLEKFRLAVSCAEEGTGSVNKKINADIQKLILLNHEHKIADTLALKQELWYLLNQKQLLLGKNNYFDKKIQNLKEEKNKLLSLGIKSVLEVNSPGSGNFIKYTDGYENTFNYRNILSFDFKSFDLENLARENYGESVIGKIVKSETWYAIINLSEFQGKEIQKAQEIFLSIESMENSSEIPCKIEKLTFVPEKNSCVLLISCDYMNKDLAAMRNEEFKINMGNFYGIKLSKKMLHCAQTTKENQNSSTCENFEENFGVYVKCGNYLKFKKIKPVFSNEETVMCAYTPEQYNDENYLQPGDKVIVKGTDLYEGKRI